MSKSKRFRFAFDIGGTFTDLVLRGSDGSLLTAKVLSDPINVLAPIARGLLQLCLEHRIAIESIDELVVGATTAVTNLIIERKGSRTALITTKGFRDVIAIGRELRYDIYNLAAPGPDEMIDRSLRLEIDERTDAQGMVLKAPSVQAITSLIDEAVSKGAEAIAVCLLHSFSNPQHEVMIREVAQKISPKLFLSLSHEVLGELREYERTVATVLNAYVAPKVGDYLDMIQNGLRAIGLQANLRVMQSNGGIISKSFGERFPIRLLESGPAAGALGAAHAGLELGLSNLMAFDMGGTTAKACLISDGEPGITTDFEAARTHRFKKGSGLPVRIPTVDLIEIGAGGGSIAHVDATGLLKVGPQSAGSSPGPACYGLGGRLPTVTDAAVLMGYLDPQANLSDQVQLQADLAARAMDEHVAQVLGLSVSDAAAGVHRIVCEQMAAAAKIHAVEKAKDIRRSTLLAFGGAGPIHAREVARRTSMTQIVIPASAGVFSAFGLLIAPMKLDLVRTRYQKLTEINLQETEQLLRSMELALTHELNQAAASAHSGHEGEEQHLGSYRFARQAEMRYIGQGFEVATPLVADLLTGSIEDLISAFETRYRQLFGTQLQGSAVEVLNWRVEAFAADVNRLAATKASVRPQTSARPARRLAFFPCLREWFDTPVLQDSELLPGASRQGPALIEQSGSTVVVGPGDLFFADKLGNIHVSLSAEAMASGQKPKQDESDA